MENPYNAVGASPFELTPEDKLQFDVAVGAFSEKLEKLKPAIAAAGQELATRLRISGIIENIVNMVPTLGDIGNILSGGAAGGTGGLGGVIAGASDGLVGADAANIISAFIFGKIRDKLNSKPEEEHHEG